MRQKIRLMLMEISVDNSIIEFNQILDSLFKLNNSLSIYKRALLLACDNDEEKVKQLLDAEGLPLGATSSDWENQYNERPLKKRPIN